MAADHQVPSWFNNNSCLGGGTLGVLSLAEEFAHIAVYCIALYGFIDCPIPHCRP